MCFIHTPNVSIKTGTSKYNVSVNSGFDFYTQITRYSVALAFATHRQTCSRSPQMLLDVDRVHNVNSTNRRPKVVFFLSGGWKRGKMKLSTFKRYQIHSGLSPMPRSFNCCYIVTTHRLFLWNPFLGFVHIASPHSRKVIQVAIEIGQFLSTRHWIFSPIIFAFGGLCSNRCHTVDKNSMYARPIERNRN